MLLGFFLAQRQLLRHDRPNDSGRTCTQWKRKTGTDCEHNEGLPKVSNLDEYSEKHVLSFVLVGIE